MRCISKNGVEGGAKDVPLWHAMEIDAVFKALDCGSDLATTGLTSAEARARIEKHGLNELSPKREATLLQKIWARVANFHNAILAFVAVTSAFRAVLNGGDPETRLSDWIQVGLIVGVITINTAIGFLREGPAEEGKESLKNMLSSGAVVIRDGKEQRVPRADLVPGDIARISLGDRVPADLRMVAVGHLASAEAALTGESVPADKTIAPLVAEGDPTPIADRTNMCFGGTLVARGTGVGVVVATGDDTEIGMINRRPADKRKTKTIVEKEIIPFFRLLSVFVVFTAICTFLVAWLKAGQKPIEAFFAALVCAVAMIPEGLEAIVTVAHAWAIRKMAQKNAIVRTLPASETLGSMTTIVSDKTGTLTQNSMSLAAFVTSDGRYRIDTNSRERTSKNVVLDPAYVSQRAVYGNTEHGPSGHSATGPTKEDKANESPDKSYVRKALSGGLLCSKCTLGEGGGREGERGNPTEISILRAAYFAGIDVAEMKDSAPVIAEVPFSSEHEFVATVHEPFEANDGLDKMDALVVHAKGATDGLIPLCRFQAKGGEIDEASKEPFDKNYWIEQIDILGSHGFRVLALARGSLPMGSVAQGEQLAPGFVNGRDEPWLTMVGLCAIIDPPRPECIRAVSRAQIAGIRVAMVTGDHKDTALAIGSLLGLVDEEHSEAISGGELDAMTEEEMKVACGRYNVFARASPTNKLRVLEAMQATGGVCGITGDGCGCPAFLKPADVGIAMGLEGTDVAREAADMVLADDSFSTIIAAVKESRAMWSNFSKVLLVSMSISNAQGMSILFGMVLGVPQPALNAIQVWYCNLVCAAMLGFVAAAEPAEDGVMECPPRPIDKRLIGRSLVLRIAIGTVTLAACTVGSVFWLTSLGADDEIYYDLPSQRSMALNVLCFAAMAITISARFAHDGSFHPRVFCNNQPCWWCLLVLGGLQAFITYTPGVNGTVFRMGPMDRRQWGIVGVFSAAAFFVMEAEKWIGRLLHDREGAAA